MPVHKFAIGQKVRFKSDPGQAGTSGRAEAFIVAQQLPDAEGVYQYRIESEVDGHRRVAREDQLADL
jgi:hypothetical protein